MRTAPRTRSPSAPHPAGADAEFRRLKRRLSLALLALVAVTGVGIVGFAWIGRGEHGLVDAIYMTVITLTTVGFGEIIDMSAHPQGRLFTVLLLLVGMGIVAYTVPMLAAFVIEGQLHHIFSRRRMQKTIAQVDHHYLVCGDTAAAWYVAEELLRTGRAVVLVTPSEEALEDAAARLGDPPRLAGDPTDDAVLLEAGIARAAGIVLCMESDKDNVLGALTARRLAPRARIIASTERAATEPKLRAAGADAVVSPSRIGGLRIASELVRPKVVSFLDQMLREPGGSLRVEELTVPGDGRPTVDTVRALAVDELSNALLLAVRHAGREGFEFKPEPDTRLEPGMTLVVMTDAEGRARLERRLRG